MQNDMEKGNRREKGSKEEGQGERESRGLYGIKNFIEKGTSGEKREREMALRNQSLCKARRRIKEGGRAKSGGGSRHTRAKKKKLTTW
jgi:hypothetical protein